jgi:hypothetical protein
MSTRSLLIAAATALAMTTPAHAVDTDGLTKISAMLMVYDAQCEHIPQPLAALVSEVARTTPKNILTPYVAQAAQLDSKDHTSFCANGKQSIENIRKETSK